MRNNMVLYLNDILQYGEKFSPDTEIDDYYRLSLDDYQVYSKDELNEKFGENNYNEDYFIPLFIVRVAEVEKEYLMNTHQKNYIAHAERIDPENHLGGYIQTFFEDEPLLVRDFYRYLHEKALQAAIEWCKKYHIRYRFDPIEKWLS